MVKAKKIWGQHFLNAPQVLEQIMEALPDLTSEHLVVEVGPGTGVLTQLLAEKYKEQFYAVEVDPELYEYLQKKFPHLKERIIHKNFLVTDISRLFKEKPLMIVGNFPYNISSQIVFRAIENRNMVTHLVGMFQKEMAKRIVAPPGSKDYGILSVFTKAWFYGKYLFDVDKSCFNPPPKVMSGVIRLDRNNVTDLNCNEALFIKVVKAAFNQRRKMLRNSLSALVSNTALFENEIFTKRPEQLSLEDFISLTQMLDTKQK